MMTNVLNLLLPFSSVYTNEAAPIHSASNISVTGVDFNLYSFVVPGYGPFKRSIEPATDGSESSRLTFASPCGPVL